MRRGRGALAQPRAGHRGRVGGQIREMGVSRQLDAQTKLRLTVLIRGLLTKPKRLRVGPHVVSATMLLYGECMARFVSTTVRLDEEDVRALKRARAAGISASDLIRKGLRVVASRYYSGRRPPSTLLFESTNSKLGDESELFRDIED